jgi:hypothetical protein
MSRNLANSALYDVNMIDDRNERPLTIAFATIVTMWLLGLGWFSFRLTSMPSPWRKAPRRSLRRLTSDRSDDHDRPSRVSPATDAISPPPHDQKRPAHAVRQTKYKHLHFITLGPGNRNRTRSGPYCTESLGKGCVMSRYFILAAVLAIFGFTSQTWADDDDCPKGNIQGEWLAGEIVPNPIPSTTLAD